MTRWYNHIKSYEAEFGSLSGSSSAGEAFLGGAAAAPAKAEEDDDEVASGSSRSNGCTFLLAGMSPDGCSEEGGKRKILRFFERGFTSSPQQGMSIYNSPHF